MNVLDPSLLVSKAGELERHLARIQATDHSDALFRECTTDAIDLGRSVLAHLPSTLQSFKFFLRQARKRRFDCQTQRFHVTLHLIPRSTGRLNLQ